MRSLWTAASGMKAMQFSVDTIANNLANVSTTAYKKEKPEFEDLLYVTMQQAYSDGEDVRPVNLQVGHGVVARANVRDFSMGNIEQTGNKLDMAIQGDGFFIVRSDGNPYYTGRQLQDIHDRYGQDAGDLQGLSCFGQGRHRDLS